MESDRAECYQRGRGVVGVDAVRSNKLNLPLVSECWLWTALVVISGTQDGRTPTPEKRPPQIRLRSPGYPRRERFPVGGVAADRPEDPLTEEFKVYFRILLSPSS